METQKIISLLNDSSNEESKFAIKKWYVIDSQTKKGKWKQSDAIKFETETIKSSYREYNSKLSQWFKCCVQTLCTLFFM